MLSAVSFVHDLSICNFLVTGGLRGFTSVHALLCKSFSSYTPAIAYVGIRLLKLIYVGGCSRDMAARCPAGWSEGQVFDRELSSKIVLSGVPFLLLALHQHNTCAPPDDYDGRCGVASFDDLDQAEKREQFSWKCRAGISQHLVCTLHALPVYECHASS